MAPSESLQRAEAQGEPIGLPIVTLQNLLSDSAQTHPDKVALICRHQPPDFLHQSSHESGHLKWTYSQLRASATRFAASMHHHGVRKGMRIAAFLYNGAQFAVGIYGAALLGCTFVPINPNFAGKSKEVQHVLGLAEATVLMAWDAQMATTLTSGLGSAMMDSLRLKVVCNRPSEPGNGPLSDWMLLEDLVAPSADRHSMPPPEDTTSDLEDLALIIFTSGTTSLPKAVKQRNRTFVAGIRSAAQGLALDTTRSSCNNLPQFHIFGIMYTVNFWSCGGSVCFSAETFNPTAALRAIHEERLTNLPGVPSMLEALRNHPSVRDIDATSLLEIDLSAAVILPETIKAISASLGVKKIAASFGMSEGVPITTIPYRDLPYQYNDKVISSGKCCPGARIRICAPDSRDVLECGVAGELHMGGPMVTDGYLGNASGNFYGDDGSSWVVSGDQAIMQSNGEVYVTGRYKDVIIRAGENISPASIEAVLDTLPGWISQVVGVADEVAGEVPVAVLKLQDNAVVDRDAIRELVVDRLGAMFVPADVVSLRDLGLEDFPKTDSGKIQKAELKPIVNEYFQKSEGDANAGSTASKQSLVDTLHTTWSALLGVSKTKLDVSTSVEDFADSITMMRAVNKIQRQTNHTITLEEIMENPTIEQQADLLQSRDSSASKKGFPWQASTRAGPPGLADMVHTHNEPQKAAEIRAAFNEQASTMDLTWERDVEDVMPIWDFGQLTLRRRRPQSWNQRHAYATTRAAVPELRAALERCLGQHPMLRTLAVQPRDTAPSHVVVRSTDRWFRHIITELDPVDTADDLKTVALNDPKLDVASTPGPLFRVLLVPITKTGTAGLIYTIHHSNFDALSILNLIDDLKTVLEHGATAQLLARASYKAFADNYYLHRTSVRAQVDCNFHVQRLRGLAQRRESLWPRQRAPEWFKGSSAGAEEFAERKNLDGDKSIGVDGIARRIPLPHLQRLKNTHSLAVPAVLKTALAVLNDHYTQSGHAVFANYEAGRQWPFQAPWIADLLPNAMDVNGPMLEAVLNSIAVDGAETCLAMLRRVNAEQKLLTRHAHAPLLEVQRQLGAEDGADLLDAVRRQMFNWLPGLQSHFSGFVEDAPLKTVQTQTRPDVGLQWYCGLIDREVLHVTVGWDDAQLYAKEVEEMLERFLNIAVWMTDRENWEAPVGKCPYH